MGFRSGVTKLSRFLPGLHGLRALAALSVLVFHMVGVGHVPVPHGLSFIPNYFGLGVQLFFVISAFSLAHSTYRLVDRPGWIRVYATKRFFRIAPLFYAAIVYFTLQDYLVYGVGHAPSEYVLNVLFLHNFVPGQHESLVWAGWTIGVEMIFYALLPMLLVFVTTARGALIFFALSSSVAVSASIFYSKLSGLPQSFDYMSFLRATPSFAAGLLAFHSSRWVAETRLDRSRVLWCSVVVIVLFLVGTQVIPFDPIRKLDLLCWSLVFGACCVWQSAAPGRVMSAPAFQYIGERSYSVYLVHAATIYWLIPVYRWLAESMPLPLAFAACITVSVLFVVAIATITYRLIEVPFIRMGANIAAGNHSVHR